MSLSRSFSTGRPGVTRSSALMPPEELDDDANRSSFHVKSICQHPVSPFCSTILCNCRANRFSSHRMVSSGNRSRRKATDELVLRPSATGRTDLARPSREEPLCPENQPRVLVARTDLEVQLEPGDPASVVARLAEDRFDVECLG